MTPAAGTIVASLAVAAALWAAGPAAAQQPVGAPPADRQPATAEALATADAADPGSETERAVERGRLAFRIHCRTCHGDEARGDGPLAAELETAPPDLTLLSARNGGVFPTARLRMVIDGRTMLRSHGSGDMPIWGLGFSEPGKTWSDEEQVGDRIDDLLAYLETLQREAGEPAAEAGAEG
jgi:mono/diheme cytochrome c family protein